MQVSPVFACLFDLRHHVAVMADLAPEETARAARFMREEDRQRYLLGRTLIRRLCGAHLRCEPRAVELQLTAHGKPYLAAVGAAGPLEFNVGHSGSMVALAWSHGHPVGIDVEALDRPRGTSFRDLARAAFSPAEQRVLEGLSEPALSGAFYRIWVRKEAIVKAEGCGIGGGAGLKEFSVARVDPAGEEDIVWPATVDFPGTGRRWQLVSIPAPARYEAAVAMPADCALRMVHGEGGEGSAMFGTFET